MGRVFGQAEVCRVFGTSSEGKMSRLISRELGSLLGGNFRRQEVLGEHFGIFFQGLDSTFLSEVMKSEKNST